MIDHMHLVGLSGYSGSGKTAVAEALYERGYRIVQFSTPIKKMVAALLTSAGLSESDIHSCLYGDLKNEPLSSLYGVTPRYLMQTLGTEWGRDLIEPSIWTDICMRKVNMIRQNAPVVIDDVRFEQEAEAIRQSGGVVFRITRPMVGRQFDHRSEDLPECDFNVENDGTIEDVVTDILEIMTMLDYYEGRICDEVG